ncbi:M48 family metalloprotease [Sphingomonas azotifigens]|uniref:M48 family metalloprotease n=1 Tax=Sphingomonas azotifigens TaxID=330920 RepID=UPI000A05DB53|nr:M48 family metalloprotease [Sphingomonas azotifigens]
MDPASATDHYLATIPAARAALATAYTQGGHWLVLWGWLFSVLVPIVILRPGLMRRIAAKVAGEKDRKNRAVFAVAVTFFLLHWALLLPWSVYADWWRERSYGITSISGGAWFAQSAISTIFSALSGGVFLVLLYLLIRRTGRRWWIWGTGISAVALFAAIVLQPVLLGPVFQKFTPLPQGPVRETVMAIAHETGTPAEQIVIAHGGDGPSYTARVDGLGSFARIVLGEGLVATPVDTAALRAVVGHEIGHYQHQHLLWLTLFMTVLVGVALLVIDRLFAPVARLLGAGDRSLADPAGLPVLAVIFATFVFLTSPLINTALRTVELDADRYGLEHAREPDGAARALLKTVDYRAPSPGRLEEVLFYEHPSIRHRLENAMVWKAAHSAPARATAR